ncbi:MAG: hypothetical protein JO159_05165 [Acidobacteria bacterium]|nr:hypothetical protein [Acidobacteriota bacterium]
MNRATVFSVGVILAFLSSAAAKESSSAWETCRDGVKFVRLEDKTVGPTKAQIAILQLTGEEYKKLQKDLKAFVEGCNIFGETVRPNPRLTELWGAPEEYSGGWVVMAVHRESWVRCASYPTDVNPGGQKQEQEK